MSDDHSKLLNRKQELETELDHIQNALDLSIDNVRSDVGDTVNPKHLIRRYPLPVAGAALLVGFLAAYDRRSPRPNGDGEEGGGDETKSFLGGMFTAALAVELKRMVTKKAVRFASEYLEEMLDNSSLTGGSRSTGKTDS